MKNNRFFAVFAVILLFNVGLAGAENIQRPWKHDYAWEKQKECAGGPPPCYFKYHDQLAYLNLSSIETGDADIDVMIEDALSEKYEADYEYEKVEREYSELVYMVEHSNVTIIQRCIAGVVVGSIVLPGFGTVVGCVGNMLLLQPELEKEHDDVVKGIERYNPHWTAAMDNAFDALESSEKNAGETVGNARNVYKKMKDAGLCSDSYTWNPGTACRKLRDAMSTVDSGDEGSLYGKVNLVHSNIEKLEEDLREPDATLYYPTMELIWGENGVIPVYSALYDEGTDALAEADDIYNEMKEDAYELKTGINDYLSQMESNRLDVITESKTTGGVAEALESAGTIEERYSAFSGDKEDADGLYDEAGDAYTAKREDYLAAATVNMDEASEIYAGLDAEAADIIADAEAVVDDKKDEADQAIQDAEDYINANDLGTEARALLESASEIRDSADESDVLGDRYLLYVEAIELAGSITGERRADEEISYNALVTEVRGLLSSAKTDGIYVADLEEEFGYVEAYKPSNAESRLESIKRELQGRAELVYGYLQDERDVLYEMLVAAGADDLLDELEDAERGIVYNGKIDYLEGLGKLKMLAGKYDDISEELESDEQKRNDAIANQMVVETSLLIDAVEIDYPTDVIYVVTVTNPKSYGGYEIEVRVHLEGEFNFMYSDVVSGSEDLVNVRTSGNDMYLLFGEISAFERKTVTFEKSAVLARTRSMETEAFGLGDGTARVEETVVFELDVDDAYVRLPDKTGIMIDGLYPDRPLSEGVHTMTGSYTDYDAYMETRSDAVVAGTDMEAVVSYDISIEPAIDLVEVPVFADVGNSEYVEDVSIDCGIYDCVKENNAGSYAVTVYDLVKGVSSTISISYTVTKLDDYISLELEKYRSSGEPEIQQLVDEAESYLLAGNHEAALLKLEEIKKKVSEIEKEKAKLLKKYYELARKINNEIEDLGNALAKAGELGITNNSEVIKLETRKQSLEEELARMNISDDSAKDEIQEAVDDLGKIDMNWLENEIKTVGKQAGKEFESYKKEFAEFDNSTANSMLKQFETDINVLLATGKATDMVIVLSDMENLDGLLSGFTDEMALELENLMLEFDDLKDTAETLLRKYDSEYNDAKKYGMDGLFPITPKSVTSLLSETEKLLENGKTRDAEYRIQEKIPGAIEKMQDTLKLLSSNAYRKIDEIDYELEVKRAEFSGEQISQIEKMKTDAMAELSAGNYVKAIQKAADVIGYIKDTKGKGNTALYLVLASVLIAGALGAFLIYQKKKKPKMKILGKEKLEKSKDEPQELPRE